MSRARHGHVFFCVHTISIFIDRADRDIAVVLHKVGIAVDCRGLLLLLLYLIETLLEQEAIERLVLTAKGILVVNLDAVLCVVVACDSI